MTQLGPESRGSYLALAFLLIFAAIFLLHSPLLNLPYFWDEAGYYVPAARDLLLNGSLVPQSTVSSGHPPLVMAYLALCWKIAGYAPAVTRTAMLLVAAFSLLGVFRLALRIASTEVAIASTLCTALYPVFFSQSSLAHLDMAAAGLIFWGLCAYVKDRRNEAVFWFSLAVLAKETAILAPLALILYELAGPLLGRRSTVKKSGIVLLAIPLVPLSLWYAYHYQRTGFIFGSPEFFRYNVQANLHPLRMILALLMRLWQTFGYFYLYLLTLAGLMAMWRAPLKDEGLERPRIAVDIQLALLSVILANMLAMAVIGGAVLARYMLPTVPLVIIILVSTLRRRVRAWPAVVAIVGLAFVAGWFVNPPYGFALEDNLAYRDYILLHQQADRFVEARYPMARVLTAWPASDELSRPYLGYLTRPLRVERIDDFTLEHVQAAAETRSHFDVALVFSTKYQPPHPLFEGWSQWQEWKTQFFGYHRDVVPTAAAQILGGQLVYAEERHGQWVGVIEMDQVMDAQAAR